MPSKKTTEVLRVLAHNYYIGEILGKGGYGRVYAAVRRSDCVPVAIKIIKKYKMDPFCDEAMEVCLMRRVCHVPGVIQLLDDYYINNVLVIVMERMENSMDLMQFSNTDEFTPLLAQKFFHELVEILIQCLASGVIHHDVKPENILVDRQNQTIKLIDFGCGTYHRSFYTQFRGTGDYLPPEYYRNKVYHGEPATVWSLGVLLFNIMYRHMPFDFMYRSLADPITTEYDINFWEDNSVPPQCRALLQDMLVFDANKRISLKGILSHPAVSSPWFDLSDMEEVEELIDLPIVVFDNYEADDLFGDCQMLMIEDLGSHRCPTDATSIPQNFDFGRLTTTSSTIDARNQIGNCIDFLDIDCGT